MSDDAIKPVNQAKNSSPSSGLIQTGAQQPVSSTQPGVTTGSVAEANTNFQVACCFASAAGGKFQV